MKFFFASLLFLLSPLLSNISAFLGVSWGDVAVIIFLLFFFVINRCVSVKAFLAIVYLFILFIFVVVHYSFISYLDVALLPVIRMFFYAICFFIFIDMYKNDLSENIVSIYFCFSLLCAFLLCFQFLFYKLFGVVFVYIETPYDIEINSVRALGVESYGLRSGGVFKEPSYYAIFMIPALYYAANARRYLLWTFYSITILLSTSVLGYLFVLLSLLRFFSIRFLFSSFFLFGFFTYLYLYHLGYSPIGIWTAISGQGSFSVRITEPFVYIYSYFDSFLLPGLESFDTKHLEWLNSLSYALILCGLPAISIVFLILKFSGKSALVAFVLLAVTNSLSGPYFLIVMVMMRIVDSSAYSRKFTFLGNK